MSSASGTGRRASSICDTAKLDVRRSPGLKQIT
jgi:hypothetical protein